MGEGRHLSFHIRQAGMGRPPSLRALVTPGATVVACRCTGHVAGTCRGFPRAFNVEGRTYVGVDVPRLETRSFANYVGSWKKLGKRWDETPPRCYRYAIMTEGNRDGAA